MNTKTFICSLLFLTSPAIMANPVYQSNPTKHSHHEAASAGVGLVAGSIVAGPIGAIIGGSLGVFSGHQQTQNETITEQQHFLTELKHDLDTVNTELAKSNTDFSQLETSYQQLQNKYDKSQQKQNDDIHQLTESYQLDIYFLSNSHCIQSHAQQGLSKLAVLLKNNPNISAHIDAHSDWRGTDEANFKLAEQRLDSVTQYLLNRGVKSSTIQTTNYGERNTMINGSWGEQLFYDRRVTITLNFY